MGKELLERDSAAIRTQGANDARLPDPAAGLRKLEQARTPPGQLPPGIKPYDAARYTSADQIVKALDGDVFRYINHQPVPLEEGDVVKPGQSLHSRSGATIVLFDPLHGEWRTRMEGDSLLKVYAHGPPVRKTREQQKTQVMVREGSVKGGLAALDAASETKDAGKGHETPPK